ncbi:SCY1 protein kinase [Niveomyces insectorum RCEF 264]|uniref:SCY1 protein kinase n=1 Tax=Niveomyces insectorum RCEF 264 TaxID=1081102 RepID=A0A167VJK1_9HYPO|nr:SCY1 protein kinase [Niveomyces insectorum RCEF 264]
MFSSAFKSISSTNINSHYTIAPSPTSTAGPWKIYDAKKKSTGKAYSVFVFDRKSLDAHASSLGRSGASAFRRAADEVVDRLKKEASSLARLRHPSVLELVEPVEETRGGGLQFATEAVTASLAGLLQEKDDQERAGGVGGRASRYVTEDADGVRRRREIEIDELEIQKGLLQLGKALEFLHENAGLVHGNLTPDAVLINAKSDWKISGLSFCGPAESSSGGGAAAAATGPASAFAPVSIHEILNLDARLPHAVQLNLDFAAPDLVLDHTLTPAADMFALGLLCVALYNSPHRSPIESHASVSSYKRIFSGSSSSSGLPTANNNFGCARPLPRELAAHVLPRLLTRRPAQRMSAQEFQTSEYFDNILVSTIRFLDAFPAKTHGEKAQFMRGLNRVLPSFPKSVMEKKVLPALLDELKDRELAPQILQNVFKIVDLLPSAKRVFSDRVLPCLKELFLAPGTKPAHERDPPRDASLMVVLDRLSTSPTPSVVDAALRSIPVMLPVLDFSTIKNELFPVVAAIFSKTSSLAIKIRGLQAFVILCGGSLDGGSTNGGGSDGLDGLSMDPRSKRGGGSGGGSTASTALDKYTMQEKIVPLIKAIKTKEPAVMMEALNVLRVVGRVADAEFVALELLPVLWTMGLGPLLNFSQFQAFMTLIKSLSVRVEEEQAKKLQELSGADAVGAASTANGTSALLDELSSFGSGGGGGAGGTMSPNGGGDVDDDFERLVKGKTSFSGGGSGGRGTPTMGILDGGVWDAMPAAASSSSPSPMTATTARRSPVMGMRSSMTAAAVTSPGAGGAPAATFSWSTPAAVVQSPLAAPATQPSFRTITPDLGGFAAMTPTSTQFSQALPARPSGSGSGTTGWGPATTPSTTTTNNSGINWSTATRPAANPWAAAAQPQRTVPSFPPSSSFSLPPPPQFSGGVITGGPNANMGGVITGGPNANEGGVITGGPNASPAFNTTSPSSAFSLPPPPSSSGRTSGAAPTASITPTAPNYTRAGSGLVQPAVNNNAMGMSAGRGMGINTSANMNMTMGMGMGMGMGANSNNAMNANSGMMPTQPGKTGLDKYESLL